MYDFHIDCDSASSESLSVIIFLQIHGDDSNPVGLWSDGLIGPGGHVCGHQSGLQTTLQTVVNVQLS